MDTLFPFVYNIINFVGDVVGMSIFFVTIVLSSQ